MTLEVGLLLATIIGQAVGILGRYTPFIPNKLVPKMTWVVSLVANIVLVAQKFIESIGLAQPGVAWYAPVPDGSPYALAGFGFLNGIIVFVGSAVIAYAQTAWARWVGEKGVKPVNSNSGEPGAF